MIFLAAGSGAAPAASGTSRIRLLLAEGPPGPSGRPERFSRQAGRTGGTMAP